MQLLLDTHAFLWFILNDPQLSSKAHSLIADPANEVLISPASYWEIAIKISIGKYQLHQPFQSFLEQQIMINAFRILEIEIKHAAQLLTLPFHHRDPFDRMLVAQSLVEQIPLVSSDTQLDAYAVQRLW